MNTLAWQFLLFGILGIFGEVVFTSLQALILKRSFRLQGVSYLWMFPIYGLFAIAFPPIAGKIISLNWIVRGLIYMVAIYLVELTTGLLLTKLTGDFIWQYTDRWNYKGQITLTFVPVWFVLGLLVERFFPWVEKTAQFLASSH